MVKAWRTLARPFEAIIERITRMTFCAIFGHLVLTRTLNGQRFAADCIRCNKALYR